MISVTLARRYARALLDLSNKRGETARAHEELSAIAEIFRRDPRVRRFFETPNISRAEKIGFLDRRWKPRLGRTVFALLHVLLRRRRLDHLVVIAEEFHKLAERAQGITRVLVRTAVPLAESQADGLARAVARRTGTKVVLTREVAPGLLGGAVVSLDHQVIDGSLATELWRIRRRLLQARVHGRG
ncbi:MAG TPA: ATP synthase F1 subunit delta [Candidatus Eisenbacteria bacterium]|jgi:F-type H+-transporting ATPase subunit delta